MAIDAGRIEAAVAELLAAIGEDPARPGLASTPRRFAEAYEGFFSGVGEDPLEHLADQQELDGETGELVMLRDIEFRSMCEHHLLPFLGRDMGHTRDYSENIAEVVDAEIRKLIEQAHDEAWQVLNSNRDILDKLATELLTKETLDHVELARIFEDVEKLPERPQWLSSEGRPVSDRPAVAVPSKAPIDAGIVDGGVESQTPPKRTPRPRKSPGIATA